MIEIVEKGKTKEFKSFYKVVGGGEGDRCNYRERLDLYGCGCHSNCSYCYAKSLLNFRKLWNPENPSVADIKKVEKKLNSLVKNRKEDNKPIVLRLGGMADCFQPTEKEHKNTYNAIKLLNERGIHYLIVTKYNLVATDEYLEILDKNLAHIQISLTSTNDELGKTYERATPMSERIKAIETLSKENFDVSLRLSPLIEEFIDFDKINNINCNKILIEFLRINSKITSIFKGVDFSKYTHKEGGYYHLPLEYKKSLLDKITNFKEKSICEDVQEHFNYWESNFNFNKKDCCNLRIN